MFHILALANTHIFIKRLQYYPIKKIEIVTFINIINNTLFRHTNRPIWFRKYVFSFGHVDKFVLLFILIIS